MEYSKRNQKVAVNRWARVLAKQREYIPKNIEAIQLKAAMCGFLAGDGYVKKRREKNYHHYEIKFFPDNHYMLKVYCNFMRILYNKTPHIKRKGNVYYALINSRTIYEDLTNISSFGIYSWEIPWKIFKVKGSKEAWLKAFFSAEAYVGDDHIKIQTVNKKGMENLSKLLLTLNITHKCYEYTPKNKKHSKVSIIVILLKDARTRYRDNIGFWHSKKTNDIIKSLGLNNKLILPD